MRYFDHEGGEQRRALPPRNPHGEGHHVFGMDLLREHDDNAADHLIDVALGVARHAFGRGRRRMEHPVERCRDRCQHQEREDHAHEMDFDRVHVRLAAK